ncbi:MAG UNVERIFIED_CONTAM: DUF1501 domain-containing protein [Planctomycetaceae bacterium]
MLTDLKQRGLLDRDAGGVGGRNGSVADFAAGGRQESSQSGRDHNKNAMVAWLAGGGVRGGIVHGATDELGFAAVDGRVGVPDFHATLLHLLGLGHEDLYVERAGLKERLTGVVEPRVVSEIL